MHCLIWVTIQFLTEQQQIIFVNTSVQTGQSKKYLIINQNKLITNRFVFWFILTIAWFFMVLYVFELVPCNRQWGNLPKTTQRHVSDERLALWSGGERMRTDHYKTTYTLFCLQSHRLSFHVLLLSSCDGMLMVYTVCIIIL